MSFQWILWVGTFDKIDFVISVDSSCVKGDFVVGIFLV